MNKKINSSTIKKAVESVFDTKLSIKTRKRNIIYMRAIYYKLCRNLTYESLYSIGERVNKDHATVINGLKTFDNLINKTWEKEYYNIYQNLNKNFENRIKLNKKYQQPEGFYKNKYRIKLLQNKNLYGFTNELLNKLDTMGHKFTNKLRKQMKKIVDDKNINYND